MLIGGSAANAAADFRRVFGPYSSLGKKAAIIGETDLQKVRNAGFDVVGDPTTNFPNHGRLIHPDAGIAGFCDENLVRLAQAFTEKTGL